jgi:hypothetical protein
MDGKLPFGRRPSVLHMINEHAAEKGWKQIRAGLALIAWSKLSSWDAQNLRLIAEKRDDFESVHRSIHAEFGRLICWIAFGVGGEYLVRGAFMLKEYDPTNSTNIIRPPEQSENIQEWIQRVNRNDPSIREPGFEYKMKLGGNLPWNKILSSESDRNLVWASVKLLAGKIRNRDAHRYAENVRAFHFHVVKSLFVPAFNILLASVDQPELRSRLAGS